MARTTEAQWLDPAIASYIADRAPQPDDVLRALRTETAALGAAAGMQVSADEGALLTILTAVAGASFALEVGTFTGYSSICIARGLRPGGRLLCLDVSEEYTSHATAAWAKAGLDDRIELRIGPALDSLRSLPAEEHIDIAFIDADKANYSQYFEEIVTRVRPNGLIMADNTLWSGRVVGPVERGDDDTLAIRAFNDAVAADDRVDAVILPLRDGLTLIRKR